MHTSITPYIFWITSRAAGIAALVLASLTVSLGLLMSIKLLRRRAGDLRIVHEALSLGALAALLVHGLSLLGDAYLHPSLLDISVPFVSGYETIWTSLGILAFWMMALLGLGFYFRKRIGVARWRMLHRFTALAWMMGLVHSLGEGTDAGQLWFLATIGVVAIPALALLATRYATTEAPVTPRPAAPARVPSLGRGV